MNQPLIKVKQLAYVRVEASDVQTAETFLDEFGLQVAYRSEQQTYLRGTDAAPPCYVLSQGTGGVTTIAFEADNRSELECIAEATGASIEASNEPSGGEFVKLTDPVGMQVEIVYGRTPLEALEPASAHEFNMNGQRPRVGILPSVKRGPSRVRRLGHLVLESADPQTLYEWYNKHLGLTTSDTVRLPDGKAQMIFSRLDRAEEYVDHHVVGFQFSLDEAVRVQHIAFEVGNLDDLMSGHEHLKRKKRKNVWGIGRHLLGGQIFDYWKSPGGVIHEHWTDTDLVNQDHEAQDCPIGEMQDYWGPGPTPGFLIARWNFKVIKNVLRIVKARAATG